MSARHQRTLEPPGGLLAQSRGLAARAEVVPGLVAAVRDNGELGALVRQTIVERDRELMAAIVERATRRAVVDHVLLPLFGKEPVGLESSTQA